jgi:hypothetical protein
MNNKTRTTSYTASNICKAFDAAPVGSRVIDAARFEQALLSAIEVYDFAADRVPGQGFVLLPDALDFVSAGEGRRTNDPNDYVAVEHRGNVGLYLLRDMAAACTFCAAVVYTVEAYLADPDVQRDANEAARVAALDVSHVLVAVIASAAPRAPLTYERFAANLAGGNKEAQLWTADEIREQAKKIDAHWSEWCVVAG